MSDRAHIIASVERSIPRHDGGYLILCVGTGRDLTASSPVDLEPGVRIIIRNGVAERARAR